MKRFFFCFAVVSVLAGCASQPTATHQVEASAVHRYVAWQEGSLQSGYEPVREIAEARAKQWDNEGPNPDDVDEYLSYLAVLSASGRADAEKKIKLFIASRPKDKRPVFLLGAHYVRQRRYELARYCFLQAEKDPSFPWRSLLYNNLAMMALQDKNRLAALDGFERAVKEPPPAAIPLVNLGAIYLQSKSWSDAEQAFAKARELDPGFEDAALGLGIALQGQGKYEEAHKVYADFINANSDAIPVLYNDAIVLGNHLKRREEAAQAMLRYIQKGGKETAKAHEIIQSWR